MTFPDELRLFVCWLIGHREYNRIDGRRGCLRCPCTYSYLACRWRRP